MKKVSELISELEPYKDFDVEVVVHLRVAEEELQKRTYKYPYDNYKADISVDDVSHSENIVSIGVCPEFYKENNNEKDSEEEMER